MVYRNLLCAFAAIALSGAPCLASGDDEPEELVVQPTDEGAIEELLPDAGYADGEDSGTYDRYAPAAQSDDAYAPSPEAYAPVAVPGQYQGYSAFPAMSYNYYYPAYSDGTLPARLYFSPRPVPLYVGYTYITYQGLAPHEFLWPHARCYYRYHPGSGTTVTTIKYR